MKYTYASIFNLIILFLLLMFFSFSALFFIETAFLFVIINTDFLLEEVKSIQIVDSFQH